MMKYIGCVALFLLTSFAFAFPTLPINPQNFELSAGIGPVWTQSHNSHLVVSPFETDSLRVDHSSVDLIWKIGIGCHVLLPNWRYFNDVLWELNFYQAASELHGSVWQYELPQFNNYRFHTSITSNRLMLDIKPQLFTYSLFSPYAIFGAGVAFNRAAYRERVTGVDVDPTSFQSIGRRTQTRVAFNLGLGIRTLLMDQLILFIEYLYTNPGQISLSSDSHHKTCNVPTDPSVSAAALSSGPKFWIHNHALLFGLSWKI